MLNRPGENPDVYKLNITRPIQGIASLT